MAPQSPSTRSALMSFRHPHKVALLVTILAFSVPILAYAYLGSFMRLNGDNYCYGADVRQLGFWKAQSYSYVVPTSYSGNRYSLTFFSDLLVLAGPKVFAILPGLTILAWLVGTVIAIQTGLRRARLLIPLTAVVAVTEVLLFFSFYQAPDLYQILYWSSGLLPYLAPILGITFLSCLILAAWADTHPSPLLLGGIVIVAFVAGGLSETGAAIQTGALAAASLCVLLFDRRSRRVPQRIWMSLLLAAVATGLSMIFLIVSPTNMPKWLNTHRAPPPGIGRLIELSLTFARDFVVGSLRAQPLPTFLSFLLAGLIAFLLADAAGTKLIHGLRMWALATAAILLTTFWLVVCDVAPTVYASQMFPELRTLIGGRIAMVAGTIALGLITGVAVRNRVEDLGWPRIRLAMAAAILVCLTGVYPLRASFRTLGQVGRLSAWAQTWDARDQAIRTARQSGMSSVQVGALDHIIPHVGDLGPDPTAWYNSCAAGYYGLSSLSTYP